MICHQCAVLEVAGDLAYVPAMDDSPSHV
jgi:hypothetical protein